MKNIEALKKATEIARLIIDGTERLKSAALKNLPLLAITPLFKLGSDIKKGQAPDFDSLSPQVFEILIFGSVARIEEEVGDIDFIILDNGFFSNFFSYVNKEVDWYFHLSNNLHLLLTGWLGYDEEITDLLIDINTDLHVLPMKMLSSKELRQEIAEKHKDPRFLQNTFSSILRFDGAQFVATNITYLEETYKVDLSNLKG